MKKFFVFLSLFLSFAIAQQKSVPSNIIIMIGDGMGVAQVSTLIVTNPNSPFKKFPVTGFSVTCSADKLITDSAAGGTAIACGVRTKNGHVGVDGDDHPVSSIFDYAKEKNYSTGVVVTSEVTNATPADFIGHVADRRDNAQLAEQFVDSPTDVVIGGGEKYFLPSKEGGKREDNNDLLLLLKQKGYEVFNSFDQLKNSSAKKYYALLADGDLPEGNERNYSLSDLSQKAIATPSKNQSGFVLMIEGSHIDEGGHRNDQAILTSEITDFESAVGYVLNFAERDGNTLVIVLADHETGGAAITGGDVDGKGLHVDFSTKSHTASMVGVYAFGPQSNLFSGINDNYVIGKKLISLVDGTKQQSTKK